MHRAASLLRRAPLTPLAAAAASLLCAAEGRRWSGAAAEGRNDPTAATVGPIPPLYSKSRLTPAFDIAQYNLAIAAEGRAGEDPPAANATDAAAYELRSLRGGVRPLASIADVDEVARGVGVLFVSRGCDPRSAQLLGDAVKAASHSDTAGLLFYAIDDSTPAALVAAAEEQLHMRLGAVDGPSSAPLLLLLDRFAKTATRHVWTPQLSGAAGRPSPRSSSVAVPVPSHAELRAWLHRGLTGQLEPTLLCAPRVPGDRHPLFPFLRVVTDPASFRDVVLDPRADTVLESYLADCPMCLVLAARVRMLALLLSPAVLGEAARGGAPRLQVAVMDVDANERPRHWMPGPAFPTVQLFNAGAGGGAGASSPAGPDAPLATKMWGPDCAAADPAAAEAALRATWPCGAAVGSPCNAASRGREGARPVAPQPPAIPAPPRALVRRVIGNAPGPGSPACVPALDFRHPTTPDRMALPSVPEMLYWVATHCSCPFDPAALVLPPAVAEAVFLNAAVEFPDYAQPRGSGGPPAAASASPPSPSGPLSLLQLAADMEVEARVLEEGVFHVMWLASVEQHALRLFGGEGSSGGGGEAHHPLRPKLPALAAVVAEARAAVLDRGMYGTAGEARVALDAAEDWMAQRGVVEAVRRGLSEEEEAKTEVAALQQAQGLLRSGGGGDAAACCGGSPAVAAPLG